jgi:hypothetical protein
VDIDWGADGMGRFSASDDFENRFEELTVKELQDWRVYWIKHAEHLQPKIQKLAMKRVHRIDRAIKPKNEEAD